MIWAEKLRERTLGSAFAPAEIPELLGVTNEESSKIITDLMKNCWIRLKTNGKWVVLKAEERQGYVKECIVAAEAEVKKNYNLYTHLKGLLDEGTKKGV